MGEEGPLTDDGGGAAARVDPAFFDDAYYRLLEPFHPEEDARRETAALRELVGLSQDDRLLDLGCGWGRHLRLLTAAGHDAVGVDRSLELLRRARRPSLTPGTSTGDATGDEIGDEAGDGAGDEAGEPRVAPPLVAGDMLRLPFPDASFDVVINLATSLGLFLEDAPAARALTEARRVLRPGGRFLVEGMHRADVEARFAHRDAWTLDDGTVVRARRRWDPARGISHEVLRWDGPGGSGTKRHSLRIRSAGEVGALLETAGFEPVARFGDWGGEPFGPDAPRLIVLARAGS